LPVQYADFAVWQREFLAGERLEAQIGYWRAQLADCPVLELPTDRPRPPVRSAAAGVVPFELPAGLAAGLERLARAQGVTVFMALLAGFQLLLGRWAGQEDVAVGSPIAGRTRAEVERLIGFFVNTLVLRADLSGDASVAELLARTREAALAAYANQDVPFERLVEELNPERDLSRTPLFQVMLTLLNEPPPPLDLEGVEVSAIALEDAVARFDIELELSPRPDGGLGGWFLYSADLFEPATIERLGTHLVRVLEQMVEAPERRLSQLTLLDEQEHDWLHRRNPQPTQLPELTVNQLVEHQVARAPDAPAVVFEGETLTYRELERRANRLAHYLRTCGVGAESVVGLCLERSPELIVALLAVHKAGGAYLPLEPTYPTDRLRYMLDQAGARLTLAHTRVAGSLGDWTGRIVCLDAEQDAIDGCHDEAPDPVAAPDHLAYVIFTSGSTGRPKGVAVAHRGVVNQVLWSQRDYPLTPADRVLQKTPLTFDVSAWEIFTALASGATLVVARPEGHKDPVYLAEVIAAQKITSVHFVASMLQAFVAAVPWSALARVRRIVTSGEALPVELQRLVHEHLGPDTELVDLFGPTEASIHVTEWRCEHIGFRGGWRRGVGAGGGGG
jgi:amino acid adenylation domain-containing protein